MLNYPVFFFFFFNDTATTEIYTLSLHDALPIFAFHRNVETGDLATHPLGHELELNAVLRQVERVEREKLLKDLDRKSTRLNSSHANISYAVFCLKKKKKKQSSAIHTENLKILHH